MTSNFQLLIKADDLEAELTTTNLNRVIAEIDMLMRDLGISRWSFLKAWCDDEQPPKDLDQNGLELLLEHLCVRWSDS
jgi:hypothetical protein